MNNEYKNLISGELINNEKFSELKGNAMLLHRTDLWIEWDFVNNKNLDIYNVTKGSDKKAWWKCSKCGENYNSVIHSRVKGVNCPYCRGLKPSPKYNLSTINPTLSLEWSNINTKPPTEYTPSSGKIVWWLGKCGHEFKARIADRSSGKGCPYCVHNGKVLLGFNDITTTHPHIVEFFNEKSEACKYTKGSSKKIKFKCHCGNIMTKRISDVIKRGLNCPVCSDGISFGEKILYNLLKEYNIEFKYDSKLEWSGNKRYDFILTDYCNSIIEIHGEQHSKISTGNFKVTNLDKQIENDKFKKQLAIDNGVIDYFEIHIHNKDINQLIDNLENTGLLDFLNLKDIDWSDLVIKSHKSIVIDVCSYYSKNRKSTCEISEIYKLSIQTIIKYLKLGNDIGLCEY